jgi:hypothetical protein
MNDTIKNTIKTKMEEKKMKKTILTTVLIMTVLFIFSTVSYAQGHNNFGWHGAMASLAEKENRAKEQNAIAKMNENITAEIKVAHAEKAHLNIAEETNSAEKTDQVEN